MNVEKLNSEQIKEIIQQRGKELPEGSEEGEEIVESVEPEEMEETVEASESEEEDDPVGAYLSKWNEEKMQALNLQERSFHKKALQQQTQQEAAGTLSDFQTDVEEFGSKYRQYPEEIANFANDFRWGRVEPLTEEELTESESPQEEMFFKWLKKQKKIPSERIKGIVELYHSGPKLQTRTRDRFFGYDDQSRRKMTDDEIDQEVNKLFEE